MKRFHPIILSLIGASILLSCTKNETNLPSEDEAIVRLRNFGCCANLELLNVGDLPASIGSNDLIIDWRAKNLDVFVDSLRLQEGDDIRIEFEAIPEEHYPCLILCAEPGHPFWININHVEKI